MRALNNRFINDGKSKLPVESLFVNPMCQMEVSGHVFIFYLELKKVCPCWFIYSNIDK
jgi:hypothetical protein